MMYYCPRAGHGHDLGVVCCKRGECVDLLHNTKRQNHRQIRRLMWRMRPVEACRYFQRGTEEAVKIPRGT